MARTVCTSRGSGAEYWCGSDYGGRGGGAGIGGRRICGFVGTVGLCRQVDPWEGAGLREIEPSASVVIGRRGGG